MKQTLHTALCLLAMLAGGNLLAAPLGPAITYQGRLDRAGAPASGNYDFVFAAYDAALFGGRVAGPVTNVNVMVSNGLFTTSIDFGAGVFTGSERWLEIYVRTNGGGALTLLDPRQFLTAAPYAHYAPNAGSANSATTASSATTATTASTANAVAANSIGGAGLQNNAVTAAKIAGGQVVKTLNGLTDAVVLTPGSNVTVTPVGNNLQIAANPGNDWHLGGNVSTTNDFLGTTANVPLELRVNNARALRLEPAGSFVNVIGGHSNNLSVGGSGVTIGGGGNASSPNLAGDRHSTVGGGAGNQAGGNVTFGVGDYATVGGGNRNASLALWSTVAGGRNNTNLAVNGFIGGGYSNVVNNEFAVVNGGYGNLASGYGAAVGGGSGNVASNNNSVVGGGEQNSALAAYAFVGGGTGNRVPGADGAVAGGQLNTVRGDNGFVGAGQGNRADGPWSAVPGGLQNAATNEAATVVGGAYNVSGGRRATVLGGVNNLARGENSVAAGSGAQALHEGTFVWTDASTRYTSSTDSNQFLILASGGVGIGTNHPTAALEVGGTVKAAAFCGDGSLLTNLSGANLVTPFSVTNNSPAAVIGVHNIGGGSGSGLEGVHDVLGVGVRGRSFGGFGVEAIGGQAGIHAQNGAGGNNVYLAGAGFHAGEFYGNVLVVGTVDATQFYGNGSGLTGVNAQNAVNSAQLNGLDGTNYARLDLVNPNLQATNLQAASLRVTGLFRSGSETNAGQAPSPAGLVLRRLNSTVQTTNGVIARTDKLTLERDGTAGGMLVRYPLNPGQQVVTCTALTSAGVAVNVYSAVPGATPAGTVRLFTDAQGVASARIVFGDTFNAGHVTEVTVTRYSTDNFWIGTLTSTFNQ